jgi:hypothetical protein
VLHPVTLCSNNDRPDVTEKILRGGIVGAEDGKAGIGDIAALVARGENASLSVAKSRRRLSGLSANDFVTIFLPSIFLP